MGKVSSQEIEAAVPAGWLRVQECDTCLLQLNPTAGGKQEAEDGGEVPSAATGGQKRQSSGNNR